MKRLAWSRYAGIPALLFLVGCSDQTAVEPKPDGTLPKTLGLMQGSWESAATNAFTNSCIIDGYTIRLRYQDAPESPMSRQNSVIELIDEQNHALIINGGIGAWTYLYDIKDGEEHLELEFFSQQHQEWWRLYLRRVKSTA